MKRSGLMAGIVAASFLLATTQAHAGKVHFTAFKLPTWFKVASVATFVCASGIIGAALAKNAQQNKPLTQSEALSCGWRFWVK